MTVDAADLKAPGALMRAEAAEAAAVFRAGVVQPVPPLPLPRPRAIYTIARGSSDAAACILAYEFMATLGVPATSLPPSTFSLGAGVEMAGSLALIVSQSGGSDDLVRAAQGARDRGAHVVALTNTAGSPVEAAAHHTVLIGAGPERAIPATKSVIGAIAAGLALLTALHPPHAKSCARAADAFADPPPLGTAKAVSSALLRAQHVYVIGRGAGFGAAQEVALKLKETCALHAEAYSASEVLHGPLQLTERPLSVLMLDTGVAATQPSLDQAERRFRDAGSPVLRLRPHAPGIAPAAAAALLLNALYPVMLETALALGYDPDSPDRLAKVTRTL
ncbi:MAG: SIS domain-containing protein [Pseudomonadota bacterium]